MAQPSQRLQTPQDAFGAKKIPLVVRDEATLTALLRSHPNPLRLVAIDGWLGAGKTRLMHSIGREVPARLLDLDPFVRPGQGQFLGALKVHDLGRELASMPGLTLVAGVCALKALSLVGRKPEISIYVKRMAVWGWADEDAIDGAEIEDLSVACGNSLDEVALMLEVRQYHREYRPHLVADYVYERMTS